MTVPDCPEHGRLVLDLALGRLDDASATEAESIRERCPVCRAWWRAELDGEAAEVVDRAVVEALGSLELPRRTRRFGWAAAAAAVVMALGVGAIWRAEQPREVAPTAPERVAVIRSFDFEDAAAVAPLIRSEQLPVAVPVQVEPEAAQPAVVAEATAEATATLPVEAAEPAVDEPLSADGFETGDLSGWDPQA
jgi:hypothetical protein